MRKIPAHVAAITMLAALPITAFAAATLPGVYAWPDGKPKVGATSAATPGTRSNVTVDVAMTGLGQQVMRFEMLVGKPPPPKYRRLTGRAYP